MGELLKDGQTVKSESTGNDCTVRRFLGGGGQGEVYLADMNGVPSALKWYFPQSATDLQHDSLTKLMKSGSPNERFLWPQQVMKAGPGKGFGYVMRLRPDNYKNITDLMKRRIEPSYRAISTAGFHIANSFLALHAKGLCYRDISFGNVFFDPKDGEILICDNDNVAVDGQVEAGVLGTPRFMAPEIVQGTAKPSASTDLYSMAVLLFYMLVVNHPLEGALEGSMHCMDMPAMNKLYGSHPVFIFDPNDTSNRPMPGYHRNAVEVWPMLPTFLQDMFIKAFTEGLRDPAARIRESEWRVAMVHLRDSICYCGACGVENFYDEANSSVAGSKCWQCKKPVQLPVRLSLGRQVIMLTHETRLFPHHVVPDKIYNFDAPVAEVVRHPTNPNIWGLKNVSNDNWICTTAADEVKDVPSGRSITITRGTRINFGKVEGTLHA